MMILSFQNPFVKKLVALRDAKHRREEQLTIIDGLREVTRAIDAGVTIEHMVYCPDLLKEKLDFKTRYDLVEVSQGVFEKVSFGDRKDGVLAVARYPSKTLADLKLPKNPLVVILEAVEKPGNLGAIMRTCDSAGVDALLIADLKTDIYNPNVIRASVSTVFSLPVVGASNDDIATFLKAHQIKTIGAVVGAKTTYTQANLKGPLGIVLGSEDEGLSDFWQKHCDVNVKIPMRGLADSLNVSVTAAVLIFEAIRQRQ